MNSFQAAGRFVRLEPSPASLDHPGQLLRPVEGKGGRPLAEQARGRRRMGCAVLGDLAVGRSPDAGGHRNGEGLVAGQTPDPHLKALDRLWEGWQALDDTRERGADRLSGLGPP
jgi:hypothetical protein